MMINVYLDDCRKPLEGFVLAIDYNSCIELLNNGRINILSLDHDLGEVKTGYDVCKYIVEYNLWPNSIYLHTANPVGRFNMLQLLNRYKPEGVRVHNSPVPVE